MPAVYSTRFIQQQGLNGSASFMVPAGVVAVMRDVDAYANVLALDGALYVQGAAGQTIFWALWHVGDPGHQQWSGRQVYEAGELIVATTSVGPADGVDVTISGYLLTIAP